MYQKECLSIYSEYHLLRTLVEAFHSDLVRNSTILLELNKAHLMGIKSLSLPALLTLTHLPMNKADLVAKLAKDAGLTKVKATAAIESFIDGVMKTLRAGNKVTLVGFGTFSVTRRAARKGRNPATGASIKIKAKKVAKFRPGKELSSKL